MTQHLQVCRPRCALIISWSASRHHSYLVNLFAPRWGVCRCTVLSSFPGIGIGIANYLAVAPRLWPRSDSGATSCVTVHTVFRIHTSCDYHTPSYRSDCHSPNCGLLSPHLPDWISLSPTSHCSRNPAQESVTRPNL